MITFRQVKYDNMDFINLCHELDNYLNHAIGGEEKREKYKKFNHLNTMDYVLVAYDCEKAVGCVALREYSKEDIEVKRFFLRNEYRGQNIGGKMLSQLISISKATGYKRMILETGSFLEASVRLYSRYGFEQIPNYGGYQGISESLCMALDIAPNQITPMEIITL